MRDVMVKGWGLAEIWPNLAVLVGFATLFTILSTAMMRQEVA
jgi:ABC-type multidrug transport system permease subunit